MKRSFTDLVPGARTLGKRLRQIVSGGAVAGLTVVPASTVKASSLTTAGLADVSTASIANRAQKAQKLLLKMPTGLSYRLLQHKSHSSHSSHSSHYSGSSGGSTAAPITTSPRPADPPPVRAAEMPPPAGQSVTLVYWTGTVDSIDHEARILTIKLTADGTLKSVAYRDVTTFRSLEGTESSLVEAIDKNGGKLPFSRGEKVQVSPKTGNTNGKTIADRIVRVR